MQGTRHGTGGFTLIELLVVIGVIAIVAAAAAPAVESITGADARRAAGTLAGGMRTVFDSARLRHATCCIALDLDGRAWSARCAKGRVGLSRRTDREGPASASSEPFREEGSEEERLLAGTRCETFGVSIGKEVRLPGRARFGPVRLDGRKVEEGIASVHFFAGGRAQRAVVPVQDGDHVYTVVLEPMTGRTRVRYGPPDAEEGR
ncbi:MAG TPA: prepilin-type N-terminal cleavage/methylation domain-containing protein [Anaeromyxobacteraceae bacterium]|nr:prepilin-type N-terminal cleavage/methylation domain-containing protein [Anaeromyxobacteraceae bacterium]